MKPGRLLASFAVIAVSVPLHAQEIMAYEEYQRMDHEEPYILQLCAPTGSGAVLYFGSRHSNDPTDPQMYTIDQALRAFEPDIVLTEGGNLAMDGLTRREAVRRYGEFGLTRWVALGHEVPSENLDPPRESEIAHLQEQGFTVPQLKLFYTLRQVSQSQRSSEVVDYGRAVPAYLQHLSTERGLPGPPESLNQFEAEVDRLLPALVNWREIPAQFFYPGPQDPHHFTNDIQTASNDFRDRHHVRRILELMRSGRRVFAIVGSTHVVMQEPALRSELSQCRSLLEIS